MSNFEQRGNVCTDFLETRSSYNEVWIGAAPCRNVGRTLVRSIRHRGFSKGWSLTYIGWLTQGAPLNVKMVQIVIYGTDGNSRPEADSRL